MIDAVLNILNNAMAHDRIVCWHDDVVLFENVGVSTLVKIKEND